VRPHKILCKVSSTADVMEAMKDMFRDVLQQVMESERVLILLLTF
jgi:hypothetical protein